MNNTQNSPELPAIGTEISPGLWVIGHNTAFGGSAEIGTTNPNTPSETVSLLVSNSGTVHSHQGHRVGHSHFTTCNRNFGVRGTVREGHASEITCNRCH